MVITQTCAYIVINYVDIFDNADMVSAVIEHAETTMTTLTSTANFEVLSITLKEQPRVGLVIDNADTFQRSR